jgi:hypothetical protein
MLARGRRELFLSPSSQLSVNNQSPVHLARPGDGSHVAIFIILDHYKTMRTTGHKHPCFTTNIEGNNDSMNSVSYKKAECEA